MPPTMTAPNLLVGPGYLLAAPLATTEPTPTIAGSKFTDAWPAAWVPLGATADGMTFKYSIKTEGVPVAEYLDPVKIYTTERGGEITFALADVIMRKVQLALNGGIGALTAVSGTGATALYKVEPPDPGNEVRVMIGWESLDSTVRLVCRQTLQSGDFELTAKKAPDNSTIPCTFAFEMPAAAKPFSIWGAGTERG